jgi:hypothetical protein
LPRVEQGDDKRKATSDSRGVVHRFSRHRHSNNRSVYVKVFQENVAYEKGKQKMTMKHAM